MELTPPENTIPIIREDGSTEEILRLFFLDVINAINEIDDKIDQNIIDIADLQSDVITLQSAVSALQTTVAYQTIITGVGSPEGVVSAGVGQEYMDTTGTAGSIKYIKRDADIAGDDTQGWILI